MTRSVTSLVGGVARTDGAVQVSVNPARLAEEVATVRLGNVWQ